jgi:tRNA-2-methylthio-N6-dimethylallyladenosine synthase
MNAAESAALKKIFGEAGWTETERPEDAQLILINTCAVRETAEERFLGRLAQYAGQKRLRAKTKSPLKIACAGCAAERLGNALIAKGADFVLGTKARRPLTELLERWAGAAKDTDAALNEYGGSFYENHHEPGSHKSFVPIMNGCSNYCSYCIVPYVRGGTISRDPAAITAEIETLTEDGAREITLLGQNVNAYRWEAGTEPPLDFAGLVNLIGETVEGMPLRWVRFLSAHPKDMTSAVIDALAAQPRFCRHIHLPVQHGSDRILTAMNRRYRTCDYLQLVEKLKNALPDVTLTTDILVGFPGESEADIDELLALMNEVRFQTAFMYHYNVREGTAAARLPDRIPDEVKRERLSRVIELQGRHTLERLRPRLGKTVTALVDGVSRRSPDEFLCRTEHDEQAVVPASPAIHKGAFLEITLDSLSGNTFRAHPLN